MNFTPELLNAALERYVFKTKFTKKDKEYILKQSANIQYFHPEKTLEYLIERSEGRLDIYAPAGELWRNLKALVAFPKNEEFLGIRGNCMNFEDSHWFLKDEANSEFVIKSDVSIFLYQSLKSSHNEISILLLKAYSNKLYRILKNTLEFLPKTMFHDMFKTADHAVKTWISKYAEQYTINCYNFIDYTPEEVYSTISKFYDEENDQEFLTELLEQLKITTQKIPIKSNLEFYKNVLLRCLYQEQFMITALNQYTHIFLPNPRTNKNFPHYPAVRVFNIYKKKFVFVKDLEFALMNYENVKIEVETEEERNNGIVRLIEYHEFQNILKQAGITEKDIHMFLSVFQRTKHDVNPPILTSYGTHCKLAEDAFREIFRVFSIDINWFNTVAEKNYYKLENWFDSISDVFSETRKAFYCIEIWKIEELKNQIYEQMKKYTKKPKYVPPSATRFMTKKEMCEEIKKFGSNVKMNNGHWKAVYMDKLTDRNMSKWDILWLYDDYCLFQFTLGSRKIAKFLINNSSRIVLNSDFSILAVPRRSIVNIASRNNDKEIQQVPRFYHKLDAHRIKFLDEYVYSMSTMFFECYYENDKCLKLALDKTIQDESVKSKIISLVYEAEIRKFDNQRRSVFYLTESEFSTFCETMKKRFDEVMHLENCTFGQGIGESLENRFPIDQYSEKVQKILKNEENPGEMIIVGLKARSIFEEFAEKIRMFKDYCRMNKERTVVMRTMSEMRIDYFEDWHMFSEEVLEAIEVVLENEGKLETMREKIENWRANWNEGDNFSTITVKLFKTILNVVGIEASKFIFMPDVQFFKQYIDMPLKMGYNAMKILSPDGREVYHQSQAQFLIFQYGACDVFWNSENKKAKDKHKKNILEEMSKIGKGYTLAKPVEQSVKLVMYSDVVQKSPLSDLHGKFHDEILTETECSLINNYITGFSIQKTHFGSFLSKTVLMMITRDHFLKSTDEIEVIRKNISKAFTMSSGLIYLENVKDFEEWYSSNWSKFDFAKECIMEFISTAKFRNESARSDYDVKELVEQHYLFDESDPLGTTAKKKIGTRRNQNSEPKRKQDEDVEMKLMNLLSNFKTSISAKLFEEIQELCCEKFEDYIKEEVDEEEAITLCKILRTGPLNEPMKKKLFEYLDNETDDKMKKLKKTVGEAEKKVKPKKEEGPKVVVKYVTETKTVENCVNCRSIEKETTDFMKKIEKLERENEEYQKATRQKDEDLIMLKSQISQNKLKFREEIQKHKEDVESREAKIEQLHQEIKEYRQDSKLERESLYEEVRKGTRTAEESVKKMKIELENSKFLETAKNKKIDELTAENRQLKTSLEIAEEKVKSSENRCDLLEKQSEDMTLFFTDSIFEEDLYLDSDPNIGPFEEILRFDVYDILKKISQISEKYGISNSEIVRFQRRYDMYIRIVENENSWEKAEIPDFPIPFSAELMQNYERCLKENFMGNLRKTKWRNPFFTPSFRRSFDRNQE